MDARYYLRPGEQMLFEYTLSLSVNNMGRALDTEATYLEAQRKDAIERMARRLNEFFDAVILMER